MSDVGAFLLETITKEMTVIIIRAKDLAIAHNPKYRR